MQGLKLFGVMLVGTLLVFFAGQYGPIVVADKIIPKKFNNETLIGTELVENKSKAEAAAELNAAVELWKKEGTIYLEWSGELAAIDKNEFEFQIEKSVEEAIDGMGNNLMVNLPDFTFLSILEQLTGDTQINADIDLVKLKNDIEAVASNLTKEDTSFSISTYFLDSTSTDEILHEVSMQVGISIAGELEGISSITVDSSSAFSLKAWLEEAEIELSDESSSVLASLLYQLVLPTNMDILERHISKELPEWSRAGYEAAFKKDKMDFRIYNPNNHAWTIEITRLNNNLKGTVSGQPLLLSYEIIEETRESYTPKTIVQYSALLQQNQKQIKETGKSGEYVVLNRQITDSDGEIVETTLIAKDFYAPIQQIEVHSITKPTPPPNQENNNGTTPNNSNNGNNVGNNTGNNVNNNTNNNSGNNTNTGNNTGNNSGTNSGNNNTGNNGTNTGTNTGNSNSNEISGSNNSSNGNNASGNNPTYPAGK